MFVFDRAAEIAARQHGVITVGQIRASGASPRQLRTLCSNGLLVRSRAGVYVVAGSPPTWEQRIMAAVLSAGPMAVASHRTASGLWRLDRFRRQHLDLVAPHPARRRPSGVRLHESNDLRSRDLTTVSGIPVTSPVRTIIDVGRYVGAARLGSMLDDAVRRELTTYREAQVRFAELAGRGRDGIATAREMLATRPDGATVPDSPLEAEVQALLMGAGIEEPVMHHPVECGPMTYVLDLAWPQQLVALECDGFRFHRTPDQLDWDDRRRNELGLRGWLVMHATRGLLDRDPLRLINDVRVALRRTT